MCPDLCCPPSMVSIRHHSPLPNVVDEEKPRRRDEVKRRSRDVAEASHPHWEEKTRVQIARRLLGKILIDLRNTREEAISVAELKSSQEPTSMFAKTRKEETEYQVRSLNKNEDPRRSSTTSEKSLDQDDDDDRETKYRLDPKFLS
ncbi:hypothetical protein BHM03_00003834 [Ensete ventricosum]|nr:hypothetical protein BHM03_00003834 [Ensete ventricosum]